MVPRGCAGVPQLTCSPEYIKHAHTHTHSLRCVTDPGRIKRVIVARPGGQPSVASGRARAGRCPRARTGRPRRGAAAVRPSSEGGTAGANRLGRHDRRSPPRRRLCSERMKRPRACPTHSSRAAAPPALVARAGPLAASCRMATNSVFHQLPAAGRCHVHADTHGGGGGGPGAWYGAHRDAQLA